MSSDVLRFEIATLTEFVTTSGRRYLRGDIGGLRFTIAEEPEREPAAGGVARWSVVASPAPGKARHVMAPAPQGAPATTKVIMAPQMSEAARLAAAAADVIERNGAIPPQGDRIDDLFPAPAQAVPDDELQAAIDLLHRPIT